MPRGSLLIVGIIGLLIIFLPGYSKLQEFKSKNKSLLAEIEWLKKENSTLMRQIYRLEKDPIYIEKKAREKIGISKKGEIIYKVLNDSDKSKEFE